MGLRDDVPPKSQTKNLTMGGRINTQPFCYINKKDTAISSV